MRGPTSPQPVRCRPGAPEQAELGYGTDPATFETVYDEVLVRSALSARRDLDSAARGIRAEAVVAAVSSLPDAEDDLALRPPDQPRRAGT